MKAKEDLQTSLYERIIEEGFLYLKRDNRELMARKEESKAVETDMEFPDLD